MPRVTATLAGADFRSIHQLAPTPRPRGPSDTQRYLLLRLAVRNKIQKGASYPGLEIIAKLAAVLEVEPVELLSMRSGEISRRTIDLVFAHALLEYCILEVYGLTQIDQHSVIR